MRRLDYWEIRDKKDHKLGIHPTIGQKTNQLKTAL